MLEAPLHLREIAHCDAQNMTETSYAANIVCTCHNEDFELMHTGGIGACKGVAIPQTAEIDGHFYMIVGANCPCCKAKHLVFDADYHGWDGYVCADDLKRRINPRPGLVPWNCVNCSHTIHRLSTVISMDKEVILQEGPVTAKDGHVILDESNYGEGFDWIAMSIRCCKCGLHTPDWLSYETM